MHLDLWLVSFSCVNLYYDSVSFIHFNAYSLSIQNARMSYAVTNELYRKIHALEAENTKLRDDLSSSSRRVVEICNRNNHLIGMYSDLLLILMLPRHFSPFFNCSCLQRFTI